MPQIHSRTLIRKSTKRGEVWMTDLKKNIGSEQNGVRPCLVLTFSGKANTCVIVPASNTLRKSTTIAGEYKFLIDQVRVIDTQRLIRRIERLGVPDTQIVANALCSLFKSAPVDKSTGSVLRQ